MIKLINVTAAYKKGLLALDSVSLDIDDGEFVFIVGETGAGKTTLFKLFTKELRPLKGDIVVFKKSLNDMRGRKITSYRRKMGVVFQDFKLLENKNVYENIAYPLRVLGESSDKIKKKVKGLLDLVGLLDKENKSINELSMGQRQKVAIARALINKPKIILADEPTGNLDPVATREIMDLFEKINEHGTTVIIITHDMNIVKDMNKRTVLLKEGQVVKDGFVR